MIAVKLSLSDADGSVKIVVGQGRVQNLMAVVLEVGRLQAAWRRLPAVEEEDEHTEYYLPVATEASHANSLSRGRSSIRGARFCAASNAPDVKSAVVVISALLASG